ncbi:hypothetical protein [Methanocella paludicola]|uniref:hypothetical protein n=1 Tax=Methanocella paludicola TaxID=570267 RepID=UPI000FFB174C|nr:hypothetical protein [Methanocella paludicola]
MEVQISGLRHVPASLYNYIYRILGGFDRKHEDDVAKGALKGDESYRHRHDTQALAAAAWQGSRFFR